MAVGFGAACLKPLPRVIDRIAQKRALAQQERDCRRKVDARDHRQCFVKSCGIWANEKHHILARSLGGRWQTWNILSACTTHHRWFKAGLIRVHGNPDLRPVTVSLTALGIRAGIQI
jgi:hypothetical protein